jgi:membrane protease YdiL (CAAX protease family)
MINWRDEKEILIVTLIISLFILVTLSQTVGTIYTFFLTLYFLLIKTPYTVQISKKPFKIPDFLVPVLGMGAFLFITGSFITGSVFSVFEILASYTTVTFLIDIPWVKFVVWGIFIPFAETLFFLGVILPYLRRKLNVKKGINIDSILLILMIGSIAALFHIVSQLMSNEALLMDIIFFGVSSLVVLQYDELKQAFIMHAVLNSITMAMLLGWL